MQTLSLTPVLYLSVLPIQNIAIAIESVLNIFLLKWGDITTMCAGLFIVEHITHARVHLVHILNAFTLLRHIHIWQEPLLVVLYDRVKSGVVNFGASKPKSATGLRWSHNPIIVYIYLVNSVVHVQSVGIPQDSFAELIKLGNVSGLCVSNQRLDLLCHVHIVLTQILHKLVLCWFAQHIGPDWFRKVCLVIIYGWVIHYHALLGCSPVVVAIQGRNWRGCLLRLGILRSLVLHYVLNWGWVRVFDQVVAELCSHRATFLLNRGNQFLWVCLPIAVILINLEERFACLLCLKDSLEVWRRSYFLAHF